MHFRVVIPTFNRPDLLSSLLGDIRRETGAHRVDVCVYDDGSRLSYRSVDKTGITFESMGENHGKRLYWKLATHIMQQSRGKAYDYVIYLADDLRLAPGFFDLAVDYWQAVKKHDARAVCVNLLMDNERRGKMQWNDHEPYPLQFGNLFVWHTQWVDMCFIADRAMFEFLRYVVEPIPLDRWKKHPRLSSGVGSQISKRLHAMGKGIYQVDPTLVYHSNEHDSVMNPPEYGMAQRRPTAGVPDELTRDAYWFISTTLGGEAYKGRVIEYLKKGGNLITWREISRHDYEALTDREAA